MYANYLRSVDTLKLLSSPPEELAHYFKNIRPYVLEILRSGVTLERIYYSLLRTQAIEGIEFEDFVRYLDLAPQKKPRPSQRGIYAYVRKIMETMDLVGLDFPELVREFAKHGIILEVARSPVKNEIIGLRFIYEGVMVKGSNIRVSFRTLHRRGVNLNIAGPWGKQIKEILENE